MKESVLTLRFTRRAIGAAAIRNGEMSLLDGRFLSPRSDRMIPSALRYIEKLIQLTSPTTVVIDSPGHDESTIAARLSHETQQFLLSRQIPVMTVDRAEILSAFGVRRVIDRRQLRELLDILWPELKGITGKVKPYVADAAAASMYAECTLALNPPVT